MNILTYSLKEINFFIMFTFSGIFLYFITKNISILVINFSLIGLLIPNIKKSFQLGAISSFLVFSAYSSFLLIRGVYFDSLFILLSLNGLEKEILFFLISADILSLLFGGISAYLGFSIRILINKFVRRLN